MARPVEIIRLTIAAAAKNFGMDHQTMESRLKTAGTIPGADGNFSILDVANAVYGDLKGNLIREQTGKTAEERIRIARENSVTARELLPTEAALRVWSSVLLEYRQRVLYSEIPQTVKDELLSTLEESKLDEYFATANKNSEDPVDESSGAA